jgi:hypothetical protein
LSTSTIKVNSSNDLEIDSKGNLTILTGIEAVTQDVRLQTLMRTTENIYNINEGVAYFDYIFSPQQNYDDARKSLITAINASPDVTSVESMTLTISENTFSFEAQVNSIYGPLTVKNS